MREVARIPTNTVPSPAGLLDAENGNVPCAWPYGSSQRDPGLVPKPLEKHELAEEQDLQHLMEIGLHHGVLPEKGYEGVIRRYGICSAITMLSGELNVT